MLYQILILLLLSFSISAIDTVTIATDIWPPFRILNEDSALVGIDIDLMERVGKEMNVHFQFKRYPWVRCLQNMKKGSVDLMTGVAKTEERQEYIIYSDIPYYSCFPAFYTKKASAIKVESYSDLKKIQIGYTRSSAYFEPFNSDTSLNKYSVAIEERLLKMLITGRFDTFIGTDCQVDYDIAQMGYENDIIRQPYIPEDPIRLFFGVSNESPFAERWSEFNEILNRLIANDFIAYTSENYFMK